MRGRILRRTAALLAVAVAAALALPLTARAAGSNLGVDLGDAGHAATTSLQINQKGMREKALALVRKWRQDALDDPQVKIEGVTVREYLVKCQLPESVYLNPTWSNSLERIAVQRAAEANVSFSHTRPNGESCWTARYGNEGSSSEIIASTSDIEFAVSMWASEKSAYVNGTGGVTGHYEALISPFNVAYGFGSAGGMCVGEATSATASDQGATNLDGTYDVSISLPASAYAKATSWSAGIDSLDVGKTAQLAASFSYGGRTYVTTGSWGTSDPSVATMDASGRITGVKAGIVKATLVVSDADGTSLATKEFSIPVGIKTMQRLYNRWTGEHLYTADTNERDQLTKIGWRYEGVAWYAPSTSARPVYRLYNPYVTGGDHHYTMDKNEYDRLKAVGWKQEGVAWYSDEAKGVALERLYNPYATTGTHHYTADGNEVSALKKEGWHYEGKAWYGLKL